MKKTPEQHLRENIELFKENSKLDKLSNKLAEFFVQAYNKQWKEDGLWGPGFMSSFLWDIWTANPKPTKANQQKVTNTSKQSSPKNFTDILEKTKYHHTQIPYTRSTLRECRTQNVGTNST